MGKGAPAAQQAIIKKRCASIFRSQRQRARKFSQSLDYTADDLYQMAKDLPICPYCNKPVKATDARGGGLQFDHRQAVSRGGTFSLENLQVVCGGCNRAKARLHHSEFTELLERLKGLPDFVYKDVLMRLKAGGAWQAGWR